MTSERTPPRPPKPGHIWAYGETTDQWQEVPVTSDGVVEMSEPKLLRIPRSFRSVEEVVAVVSKLDLPNILILAEHENGNLTILDSDLTSAQANWLIDRAKQALLGERAIHSDDENR